MKYTYNSPQLKIHRRFLRKNMTEAEHILWSAIKNRKTGHRWRRQVSIGYYIVDFYCPEKKLIIEIDGSGHAQDSTRRYDKQRTEYFRLHNLQVLRFWNNEVMDNLAGVYEKILICLK